MQQFLEGLKAFGPVRLAAMGLVGLATLGLLALLAFHNGGQHWALLYGDLDSREAAQMVESLDRAHIPHQLGRDGTEILVPEGEVANARLLLAKEGLPTGGTVGYEIFDRTDTLTANQFQLAIDQERALEGELARTIRAIHGVRAARVHLVLPKREPFAREQQEAQASVLITMAGNARMDRDEIQAVLNLVAAAVPGLKPHNISIVDSRGTLLARAGEPVGESAAAMTAEEIRRATELRLSRAVEEMLEPSLGVGHVRAEASVKMNFDQLHQTDERFDPDGQVVRSQQNVTSSSKSNEGAASVSIQNNLPNPDNNANSTTSNQEGREEETTNYEISKTVRTLIHDSPAIEKISLAVMVDDVVTPGAGGKVEWHPRSPEELDRIRTLVKAAIGFDEKRGDSVEVVNLRFAAAEENAPAPQGALGSLWEHADLTRLVQTALFGIIGILTLLFVLRPMALRLVAAGPELAPAGGAAAPGEALLAPGGGEGAVAAMFGGGAGSAPLLEDEQMMSLANIEGQIRASSIRKLSELAEKHPEETVAIIRNWMAEEKS
jgi:flagellar M-ring protein FliF